MPGPLNGFRILDLSQVVSGPLGTMILADQGADVIKIEPVEGGDLTRTTGGDFHGLNGFYANLNRGNGHWQSIYPHPKATDSVSARPRRWPDSGPTRSPLYAIGVSFDEHLVRNRAPFGRTET